VSGTIQYPCWFQIICDNEILHFRCFIVETNEARDKTLHTLPMLEARRGWEKVKDFEYQNSSLIQDSGHNIDARDVPLLGTVPPSFLCSTCSSPGKELKPQHSLPLALNSTLWVNRQRPSIAFHLC
jgi:hypothetical protein